MDFDLDALLGVFIAESEDGLAAMEQALVALEARPSNREPIASIFRTVHTIKGSAAMVGLEQLSEFAHLLEDALALFRDGTVGITPVHVTILLQAVDVLRGMVRAAGEGRLTHIRTTDVHLVLRLLPDDLRAAKLAELEGRTAEQADGERTAAHRGAEPVADEAAGDAAAAAAPAHPSRARSLRVDMHKLDDTLTLVGEIAVARSRLMQQLRGQQTVAGTSLMIAAEELDRLLAELQEDVMQLRLVPLGPSFRQHLRTVRDVAANEGKLAKLVLEGEEVEVDASIAELVRDPLTHMVRNAIDHGIEYPARRRDAGKDPVGTVTLSARHEGGNVLIELKDDGAGLDRDRIVARARETGLLAEGATPSDSEIWDLITIPGFSTAEKVTELSGRGVGMDVVRRNVEALRGTLAIDSRAGQGTTIRIRLPLTLAIIQGFGVTAAGAVYVVPLEAVTECLDMPAHEALACRPAGVLNVRGEILPYLRLGTLFDDGDTSARQRENVIVVHDENGRAGLVVDALHGEMEAVIKPLGRLFQGLSGVAGSTILGDGRVALILDVPSILARARAAAGQEAMTTCIGA